MKKKREKEKNGGKGEHTTLMSPSTLSFTVTGGSDEPKCAEAALPISVLTKLKIQGKKGGGKKVSRKILKRKSSLTTDSPYPGWMGKAMRPSFSKWIFRTMKLIIALDAPYVATVKLLIPRIPPMLPAFELTTMNIGREDCCRRGSTA